MSTKAQLSARYHDGLMRIDGTARSTCAAVIEHALHRLDGARDASAQALRCDLQPGEHVRVSKIVNTDADALTSRISLTGARLAAIVAPGMNA